MRLELYIVTTWTTPVRRTRGPDYPGPEDPNYNSVPFDPRKPSDPSGLRLGTPLITNRGMKEPEPRHSPARFTPSTAWAYPIGAVICEHPDVE